MRWRCSTIVLPALLSACASQRPVKRKDFLFTLGATGGMLRYSEPCEPCETGPSAGLDLRFGHVLGEGGKVALFADLSAGESWPDSGRIVHGFVGAGLEVWPLRRLFLAGSVGTVGSGTESGENDDWGGISGRLVAGVAVAEWRKTTVDVWLTTTIGQYIEGDGLDLGVGLGWSTFFDFDFKSDPDAASPPPPLLTH